MGQDLYIVDATGKAVKTPEGLLERWQYRHEWSGLLWHRPGKMSECVGGCGSKCFSGCDEMAGFRPNDFAQFRADWKATGKVSEALDDITDWLESHPDTFCYLI